MYTVKIALKSYKATCMYAHKHWMRAIIKNAKIIGTQELKKQKPCQIKKNISLNVSGESGRALAQVIAGFSSVTTSILLAY